MSRLSAPPVLLIAGPTASGKSALALRLAEALDGEIVNADALQLYADLRLLTARPSAAEAARVPHHLFGTVDAAEAWSVGRWLRATAERLDEIAARGKPAVAVGGTGLYFRALTVGLAEIPGTPPGVRAETKALYDALGEAGFRERLKAADPAAEARILPGDRQRLTRALEVRSSTGRALSDWQAETRPALAPGAWRGVVLEPDRAGLYARCDERLSAMVGAGVLDEVAALMARKLDPALPAMKAVGLREFAAHLAGRTTLDEALAQAQQETRRYAKRQITWLRNQAPDWPRLKTEAEVERFIRCSVPPP